MITVLSGENNFEVTHALQRIVDDFDGTVERIDGSEIETRQLPDLLMGSTLFADKRLVIIKGLSENKSVWNDMADWLERVSDDIHVVFVDAKPDKRTKTYKDLKKAADVHEFGAWTDRDIVRAEAWVADEAKKQGCDLDKKSIQTLVNRIGPDQWQLYHALEKLAVFDTVTPAMVTEIIDASPTENVFNLFDAAIRGDSGTVQRMIKTLETTDDPYMVFGLLSGQAFQLAALAVADTQSTDVAKDIGAHPFALSKLAPHASRVGKTGAKRIITAFAETDDAMKTSGAEPWLLIERALITIASQR